MTYVLDLLQGIGIAAAAGLSPFLPLAVAALAGLLDVGANYDGTTFAVLESPVVLVVAIVLAVVAVVLRRRLEAPAAERALLGLALVVGAVVTAGTIDEHSAVWWPGLPIGAAAALVGALGSASLLRRTRERLDEGGRTTLVVGAGLGATVVAILSVVLPPLGLLALIGAAALQLGGRRRDNRKHAGLRVLR